MSADDPSAEENVSRIITMLESGGGDRAEELIPLVYDDLRRLARARMASQPPGQTLQATALVHEAYLRVQKSGGDNWNGRGHFFGAAAESMRQIIIDNIRRKKAKKRGGDRQRLDIDEFEIATGMKDDELLAVNEALEQLGEKESETAELVKLRFFTGLTLAEAANVLDISERTAQRRWNYARAWLFKQLHME